MAIPKEILGGGIVAAGLLQAIFNPLTTFATTWSSCTVGLLKMEWGLQAASFNGFTLEYDTSFTTTMANVSDNFGSLMTGCSVIEFANVVAMCAGIIATMAGGFGGFAATDAESTEKSFKISTVLLSGTAIIRLVGALLWLMWIMPAIADINMMEPLKHFGSDLKLGFLNNIPFMSELTCSYHTWDFGLIGTAIEIIVLFNAVLVVGIMGKTSPARQVTVVPGPAAVQMMDIRGGCPPGQPGYGMPPPGYGMPPPAYGMPPPAYGMPPPQGAPADTGTPEPPRPSQH